MGSWKDPTLQEERALVLGTISGRLCIPCQLLLGGTLWIAVRRATPTRFQQGRN